MRIEWSLIFALIFALIIAIFSVLNVESVEVNFLIAQSYIPLILIILGAALAGGVIVGAVSIYRQYTVRRELKLMKQAIAKKYGKEALAELEIMLQKNKDKKEEHSKAGKGKDAATSLDQEVMKAEHLASSTESKSHHNSQK